MRSRSRFAVITITLALIALCLFVSTAVAYDEPKNMPEDHVGSVITDCAPCHVPDSSGQYCSVCHAPHMSPNLGPAAAKGPHGLYTTTTRRCPACHEIHDAAGPQLLPGATVTSSCETCHDGTGGMGVYGAIEARTGVDPQTTGGGHSVDTTSVVPGGDAASGGSSTMAFGGLNGNLGCDDCHSPHDSQTVAAYASERWRTSYPLALLKGTKTTKLLRQHPGDTTGTAVTEYGSDWCLACHKGRGATGPVHNHPVDSLATTTTPFTYSNIARLASDDPTSVTTTGTLAGTNRGYLIPYPRTPEQGAHAPICQQCHEDARSVGTLTNNVGDAAPYSITATDGNVPTDNPRFQNFPHETQNFRLLVEADATSYYDDLCLNCHPLSQLP